MGTLHGKIGSGGINAEQKDQKGTIITDGNNSHRWDQYIVADGSWEGPVP